MKHFAKSGHLPTLIGSFLYFDISFMLWVLLGPLIIVIASDIQMNDAQKAHLISLPILSGAILRIVLGFISEYIGSKKTGQIGLIITMIPLVWGWLFAESLLELQGIALLLGVAGASFAVAVPLTSRWYPPQYQGLATGIIGAGNSGSIITTLFANRIAEHYGDWHAVFGVSLIPVAVVFILFSLLAKDSPGRPAPKKPLDYMRLLKRSDTWFFCLLYSVTFGGAVGMVNYLTIFYNTQFGLSPVQAGDFTTICIVSACLFRPLGGWMADKVGGFRVLIAIYAGISLLMLMVSTIPSIWVTTVLLFFVLMCMGIGNGSVFQLVPLRFQKDIGMVTGLVGAAGGLGGYFLPKLLSHLKLATGSFSLGFLLIGLVAAACLMLILIVQGQWKKALAVKESRVGGELN